MRPMRIAAWAILAAHIIFAVLGYGALPDRIPMHIGLDGTPGNFAPRTIASWFVLPAVAAGMQILLDVIARALPGRPHLFNFPEKARFLALPASHRAPVIAEMVGMLDVVALGVQAIFLVILAMLWDAANGEVSAMGSVLVLVAGIGLTPVIVFRLRRVSAAVVREERRAAAATR